MAKEPIKNEKIDLNDSLKKLSGIVTWFEEQQDIDVEKGLENVRQGVSLIKACKTRLSQIENEFKNIQREISEDVADIKPSETVAAAGAEIDPDNIPF